MMLAQSSQPTTPVIPGFDPTWLTSPGVRYVAVIVVFALAVLFATPILKRFIAAIGDILISVGQAFGSVRRTWREQMEDKIQAIDKKTDQIAEGTNAAIKAQNATDGTPSVNKEIEAKVERIVSNADTAVFPAIVPATPAIPTPEAIAAATAPKPEN